MGKDTTIGGDFYDRNYYEDGQLSGKSCYVNYRWMPELTIRMAHKIEKILGLSEQDTVLDYGCAKGFLVKALRILDVQAFGCDVSQYAIDHADADVREYCKLIEDEKDVIPFNQQFNWIMTKDVLEHVTEEQLDAFLRSAYNKGEKMFHVVPLGDGKKYIVPEYDLDKSHILIKPAEWWKEKFEQGGWKVREFSHNMPGIKDNWVAKYPTGNGFFLLEKN